MSGFPGSGHCWEEEGELTLPVVLSLGSWRRTGLRTSAASQFILLGSGRGVTTSDGPPACLSNLRRGLNLAWGCSDSTRGWALTSAVLRVRTRGGGDLEGLTAVWHVSLGPGGPLPEPGLCPAASPGLRNTTTTGGTTPASPGVLTTSLSPTGTLMGRRRTGGASTASTQCRACAAASAPAPARWAAGRAGGGGPGSGSRSRQVGGRPGPGFWGPPGVPPQAWQRGFTCLLCAF